MYGHLSKDAKSCVGPTYVSDICRAYMGRSHVLRDENSNNSNKEVVIIGFICFVLHWVFSYVNLPKI